MSGAARAPTGRDASTGPAVQRAEAGARSTRKEVSRAPSSSVPRAEEEERGPGPDRAALEAAEGGRGSGGLAPGRTVRQQRGRGSSCGPARCAGPHRRRPPGRHRRTAPLVPSRAAAKRRGRPEDRGPAPAPRSGNRAVAGLARERSAGAGRSTTRPRPQTTRRSPAQGSGAARLLRAADAGPDDDPKFAGRCPRRRAKQQRQRAPAGRRPRPPAPRLPRRPRRTTSRRRARRPRPRR